MLGLLPLYLRREPTTDRVLIDAVKDGRAPAGALQRRRDVVAYRDPQGRQEAARWPWYVNRFKPRRNSRTVRLNCYDWRPVWLEPKEA